MTWAETIKTNRKKIKMTQKELAEFLGVSLGTVRCWEQGKKTPIRIYQDCHIKKIEERINNDE